MSVTPTPLLIPVAPGGDEQGARVLTWSSDQYEALIAEGILPEDIGAELIGGVIVQKMGTGSLHDYLVRILTRLLIDRLGDAHDVGTQSPIVIPPDSQPEPDLWVSHAPVRSHRDLKAHAADLLLVIEVADASLAHDRGVKLPLYAAAGIPEYWIVNVPGEELERHRDPRPDGTYATKRVYAAGETLDSELLGAVEVSGIVR